LNGLNDRARSNNRICRILGLCELFACKFNFEDSLESRAVILLALELMERGFAMRPRERRETSEQDLFRSRLDQIIDMKHALVKLGRAIDASGRHHALGLRRLEPGVD
jgi:hypothetical protein